MTGCPGAELLCAPVRLVADQQPLLCHLVAIFDQDLPIPRDIVNPTLRLAVNDRDLSRQITLTA